MTAVNLRFAPESAKAAGLLEQLLSFHGLQVRSAPFGHEPATSAPCVVAVTRDRARSEPEPSGSAWTMIMDPDPAAAPPAGLLEFTKDGVSELVRRLRGQTTTAERRRGADRRTWDVRRFRYGLWLQFSRATGAGKFDVFPLTFSKRMKAREALLPELERYDYEVDEPVGQMLDRALQTLWSDEQLGFPSAVRVVEAVGDSIWESGKPRMRDRRQSEGSGL